MTSLLAIDGLELRLSESEVEVVRGLSLKVERGEIVGLVGESGCGKSLTALSVLGLLPRTVRRHAGSIRLAGKELTTLSASEWRRVRGASIGFVFQEPATALNPVLTVGAQIREALRANRRVEGRVARRRAIEILERLAVDDPDRRVDAFPHELSGGQRQRVMLAIALASEPELLIADEPTTAIDLAIQAEILNLVESWRAERGLGVLWVSHDLALLGAISGRMAVMYAGELVEVGPTARVLAAPRHPYTVALRRVSDLTEDADRAGQLATIPGSVPVAARRPSGCAFAPRCGRAADRCAQEPPPWTSTDGDGGTRCWLPVEEHPE